MTTQKPVEPVVNAEEFQSDLTGHVFGIVDNPSTDRRLSRHGTAQPDGANQTGVSA